MKPEDITSQFFALGCQAGGDVWTDKDEKEYQVLKKQILEALEFYDIVKNGEICNVMKHRELEQENKELKEKIQDEALFGLKLSEKNVALKDTIQKVQEIVDKMNRYDGDDVEWAWDNSRKQFNEILKEKKQ